MSKDEQGMENRVKAYVEIETVTSTEMKSEKDRITHREETILRGLLIPLEARENRLYLSIFAEETLQRIDSQIFNIFLGAT